MTTRTSTRVSTNSLATIVTAMVSSNARELMTFGRRRGWDCAVLGQAPFPDEPVRLGNWLIIPAHQDTSPMPERTFGRIQDLYAEGLRVKGFVVVHEAPKLLSANVQEQAQPLRLPFLSPEIRKALKMAGYVLGGLAVMVVAAVGLALAAFAIAILAGALLLPAALMGAAIVDPILIAVTEDDYWVEIDRWWD